MVEARVGAEALAEALALALLVSPGEGRVRVRLCGSVQMDTSGRVPWGSVQPGRAQ